MEKVPIEVGRVLAKRRRSMKLTQEGLAGVSSSLVRTIENGTAPLHGQEMVRSTYMHALGLVDDAIVRLAAGGRIEDVELGAAERHDDPAARFSARLARVEERQDEITATLQAVLERLEATIPAGPPNGEGAHPAPPT